MSIISSHLTNNHRGVCKHWHQTACVLGVFHIHKTEESQGSVTQIVQNNSKFKSFNTHEAKAK